MNDDARIFFEPITRPTTLSMRDIFKMYKFEDYEFYNGKGIETTGFSICSSYENLLFFDIYIVDLINKILIIFMHDASLPIGMLEFTAEIVLIISNYNLISHII